jgi:magnesium-transporting ATPase (P-type)
MKIKEVLKILRTEPKELSRKEAEHRLREFWYNELQEQKRVTLLQIFSRPI